MQISIAHSPDSDDYLLFWALRKRLLDSRGFNFTFETHDTHALNSIATHGTKDVVAVSAALYPKIRTDYKILSSGASIGRNYGPVIVASSSLSIEELKTKTISIPGSSTTSALVLSKLAPTANFVELPIEPFERVFQALASNEVDAALLIHEGQIAYSMRGFTKVVDLGQWWHAQTKLPLPLGINVIRRSLGTETIGILSELFRDSIAYAQNNLDEVVEDIMLVHKDRQLDFSKENTKKYLSMYANNDTLSLDSDCKQALSTLLSMELSQSDFTSA